MSLTRENSVIGSSSPGDFEETLRLIARLSKPEGLEERVQAGLQAAPASSQARILHWPVALRPGKAWLHNSLMRSAAAAAIVAVVIGGGWGIYSRVQPGLAARGIASPPHVSVQGGFSSAGAMRTPQTLNGPIVEAPAVAHPAAAEPLTAKPDAKLVEQTPPNQDKSATKKAVPQPAGQPAQ